MVLIGYARVSMDEQTLDHSSGSCAPPLSPSMRSTGLRRRKRAPSLGFWRRSGPATRWWWCASIGWLARCRICWR